MDELHLRNLGVIEEATLALDGGLTVLTGETGAGKTLVVTALQLLVGGRADTSLVRSGADQATIEARWMPAPAGVRAWHEPDDGEPDEADHADDQPADEAVVSRVIRASGRSRVRIDGELATVGSLADVFGPTVEVHAQDSHRLLLQPTMQRRLLDAWAGPDHLEAVTTHARAHAEHAAAVRRREEVASTATERARELDRLAFEIAEIDAVGLVDADADLRVRIDELTHADDLRSGLAAAGRAIGPDAAGEGLGEAVEALRRLPTTTAATTELQGRLDEVVALAEDLSTDLRVAAESIDADPDALDAAQARLARVRSLTRKYGPELDDVLAFRASAGERHAELAALSEDASGLDAAVDRAAEAMVVTAAVVTEGRRRAASSLVAAVSGHLAELGLAHARFEVAVEPGSITATGGDDVAWRLAANPGQEAADLATAASGGERSRVALALEVALADVTDADVLVFDEVDAGIGGSTAMQVGRKLAMLARSGRQVLCVTHLAQLAAWADRQYVVDKVVDDGPDGPTTRTTVTPVADTDRVAELARMLGGDTTDAARAHAAEVLAEAATAT
nr:DNA repair protein RecN [Salsipaludibacter albus]